MKPSKLSYLDSYNIATNVTNSGHTDSKSNSKSSRILQSKVENPKDSFPAKMTTTFYPSPLYDFNFLKGHNFLTICGFRVCCEIGKNPSGFLLFGTN